MRKYMKMSAKPSKKTRTHAKVHEALFHAVKKDENACHQLTEVIGSLHRPEKRAFRALADAVQAQKKVKKNASTTVEDAD